MIVKLGQDQGGLGRGIAADAKFAKRYSIDLSRALPILDSPGGTAFGLTDADGKHGDLCSFVHRDGIPQRADVAQALIKRAIPNLLCPANQGVLTTESGTEALVSLLPVPKGGVIFKDGKVRMKVDEDAIRKTILPDLMGALSALHDKGIFHRAIYPENIFLTERRSGPVILGECFSSPAGSVLPPAFEVIGRALGPIGSRGEGDAADDMFALGVSILQLWLGQEIGGGRSPGEVLGLRIAQGSYRAYVGDASLPESLRVLLSGLLTDEASDRWGFGRVQEWLTGGNPTVGKGSKSWKFVTPQNFAGKTYTDRRVFARALANNRADAIKFLRTHSYRQWFMRAVPSEVFPESYEAYFTFRDDAGAAAHHEAEAMLARAVTHLDPMGPVAYRGMSFQMDALGAALANAYAKSDASRLAVLGDYIATGLGLQLVKIAANHYPAAQSLVPQMEAAQTTLNRPWFGSGLERVLYDLMPGVTCFSPRFEGRWVDDVTRLMRNLDHAVQKADGERFFDRHMAAFCGARAPGHDAALNMLGSEQMNPGKIMFETLKLLVSLQDDVGRTRLPNTCQRVALGLRPLVRQLKRKSRRERVEKELQELANGGDLTRIVGKFNYQAIRARDEVEFDAARREFRKVDDRFKRLSRIVRAEDAEAQAVGAKTSVALAYGALVFSVIYTVAGA